MLEEKIHEADEIIKQLRSLTIPQAELIFQLLAKTGWSSGPIPKSEQYRLKQALENNLRQIGLSKEEIVQVEKAWHRWNLVQMSSSVVGDLNSRYRQAITEVNKKIATISQPLDDAGRKQIESHREKLQALNIEKESLLSELKDRPISEYASALENAIKRSTLLGQDEITEMLKKNSELLLDLRHYGKYLDFRRPDVWFANDDWKKDVEQ